MDNTIRIKCPTCGKILRLNNVPNINAATFTCPVCKEKHVVGQCQRYVPTQTSECEERNMAARVRHKPVARKRSYVQDKQRRAVQT